MELAGKYLSLANWFFQLFTSNTKVFSICGIATQLKKFLEIMSFMGNLGVYKHPWLKSGMTRNCWYRNFHNLRLDNFLHFILIETVFKWLKISPGFIFQLKVSCRDGKLPRQHEIWHDWPLAGYIPNPQHIVVPNLCWLNMEDLTL